MHVFFSWLTCVRYSSIDSQLVSFLTDDHLYHATVAFALLTESLSSFEKFFDVILALATVRGKKVEHPCVGVMCCFY